MKKSRRKTTEGTIVSNQESIRTLERKGSCKYTEILEVDTIKEK